MDPRRPGLDLLRTVVAGLHPMHALVVEARNRGHGRPLDATERHQQVKGQKYLRLRGRQAPVQRPCHRTDGGPLRSASARGAGPRAEIS
jgi:hypothetical protein